MGCWWPSPRGAGGQSASRAAPDLLRSTRARGGLAPILPAAARRWEQSGAGPACGRGSAIPDCSSAGRGTARAAA